MGLQAEKSHEDHEVEQAKSKTTYDKIDNTLTPELIIGICAPIGSLKEPVIEKIEEILKGEYKYDLVKPIKLSQFIEEYIPKKVEIKEGESPGFTSLMNKIEGGDELREKYNSSVLAELAVNQIHLERHPDGVFTETTKFKPRRYCYIIDSIKNKSELQLLRSVYGSLFYCFSVFSPKPERKQHLTEVKKLNVDEIERIIQTDEFENRNEGQNVRETFVEGDFIIRASNNNIEKLDEKIRRYLNLIFNSEVVTPLPQEIAMYQAKSAAGNSACLSRQVGATITDEDGHIISKGWNDVPKFGGNLYNASDGNKDKRCFKLGVCSNDRVKNEISEEIIKLLKTDTDFNFLFEEKNNYIIEKIRETIRRNSKVKDLIEFSRSVHAEMHAIITGSQLSGKQMINGKLFCTTYPCHNCARHIIAAGIKEIYFIEPYVKSLCIELHEDAITEDETDKNKVRILMYDGVAPRRFYEFFTMTGDRKNSNGEMIVEKKEYFRPKTLISLQAIPTLEQQATQSLVEWGLIKKT